MSIDIQQEQMLTMAAAARSLPGRPAISTLWRWHAAGVRGIRLETCLIGGKRYTSKEALQRFIERTTAASAGEQPPVRTNRQRERDIAAAEKELAEAGIL